MDWNKVLVSRKWCQRSWYSRGDLNYERCIHCQVGFDLPSNKESLEIGDGDGAGDDIIKVLFRKIAVSVVGSIFGLTVECEKLTSRP